MVFFKKLFSKLNLLQIFVENFYLTAKKREFLKRQSTAGILLVVASILAVLIANSPYDYLYHNLLSLSLPLNLPDLAIYKSMDLKLWIDDGLMAVFFLLVGLELKREIMVGELSSKEKMILPFCAALAGVIFPVLIYYFINHSHPENLAGMAIPAATDIAFAVGVLSLFGNRIHYSLKVFLVALAIADDLIAILIIAIFYTDNLDYVYLYYAILAVLMLFILNTAGIKSLIPYLAVAPFLWIFVLKSGVHATFAGVVLAIFVPLKINGESLSPAKLLEKILHIPVAYLILPIFAFANCGICLNNFSGEVFSDKIVLGIIFGLFVGKQVGIGLAVYLLDKFKICRFFKEVSFLEFYGVAIIAGIGFTMSLFIGNLAFDDPAIIDKIRIGVISGSILSAIVGATVLKIAIKDKSAS